jgi:glucose/arabinose dehydrogenase
MRRLPVACLAVSLMMGAGAGRASAQLAPLRSRVYVQGLSQPLAFVQDPSAPRAQYVVQQGGRIRVVLDGVLQPFDFLDLSGAVLNSGEQGLLGLAMPADYGTAGWAFVNFVDRGGNTVIARFTRSSANRFVADPASRVDLVWADGRPFIPQPFSNHNGGTLRFGPDGYLYIGMGDGGGGNDPQHNAQNPDTLLGKMLRIDVRVPIGHPTGYRVPGDNPLLDGVPVAARPEIWAFGLRNPWKFSFDDPRLGGTGAMLLADVGQSAREEVNYEPALAGGRNYGWRLREGSVAGGAGQTPPAAYLPLTEPIYDYPHADGRSITGGYVYRGAALGPSHAGRYVFADFVAGRVYSIALSVDAATGEATAGPRVEHTAELGGTAVLGNVSSIDVDADGELYLVNYSGGRVIKIEPAVPDADGDALPDAWERRFGLDASSGAGDAGTGGDPDRDGLTNAAELAQGTHPRGLFKYYLAEGATSPAFFDVSVDLVNPSTVAASVVVRYLLLGGTTASEAYLVPSQRRLSVDPKSLPALASAQFSTLVESDRPIVVSRQMTWDVARRYGAHMERALTTPASEWFLAEGATTAGFNLFYLLQNPNPSSVTVDITYLLPPPLAPIVKEYVLPATSRTTLWVDFEDPRLAAAEVSAAVRTRNGEGIVVERAMYGEAPGQGFAAGHAGAGVTSAAAEWFFAEGATGAFFDLFLLLANPGQASATGELRFLLPDGSVVVRPFAVPAMSRQTQHVDNLDPRLASTPVSTVVRSTNGVPIVAERAMWWSGLSGWHEAHVSAGATGAHTSWALAEGEAGGRDAASTYVLTANVGGTRDEVTCTVVFEDRPPLSKTFEVGANTRFTLDIASAFPEAVGRRFGVVVSSARGAPLVVEGAVYSDAQGVFWAAGSNLLATPGPW